MKSRLLIALIWLAVACSPLAAVNKSYDPHWQPGDTFRVQYSFQLESTYILMYGNDGGVKPNGEIAGRKQDWISMKLKHTFKQGDVNIDIFIPKWAYNITSIAAKFTDDNAGTNPEVTAKRLGGLGLKKNPGY